MRRGVPGNVVITLGNLPLETRAYPQVSQLISVAVDFGKDIAVGLFASWLYDKLRDRKVTHIHVERSEIQVTKEGITKLISESLEIEK